MFNLQCFMSFVPKLVPLTRRSSFTNAFAMIRFSLIPPLSKAFLIKCHPNLFIAIVGISAFKDVITRCLAQVAVAGAFMSTSMTCCPATGSVQRVFSPIGLIEATPSIITRTLSGGNWSRAPTTRAPKTDTEIFSKVFSAGASSLASLVSASASELAFPLVGRFRSNRVSTVPRAGPERVAFLALAFTPARIARQSRTCATESAALAASHKCQITPSRLNNSVEDSSSSSSSIATQNCSGVRMTERAFCKTKFAAG
mmetsp:Transcript_19874/g.35328  ORF Transcript_19874/g.35328 Transcript_19874/m.35328 type:complete len:256 (+) Transcript_19874:76-843(+)